MVYNLGIYYKFYPKNSTLNLHIVRRPQKFDESPQFSDATYQVKKVWRFSQIIFAFSEYMNFKIGVDEPSFLVDDWLWGASFMADIGTTDFAQWGQNLHEVGSWVLQILRDNSKNILVYPRLNVEQIIHINNST